MTSVTIFALLENGLPLVIFFGEDVEGLERNRAFTTGTVNLHLGTEGDERRSRVGRVDDDTDASSKDAVVAVLAVDGEALRAAFFGALEVTPEVPAAGPLAEVSSERSLVPKLWAGHGLGRLGQIRRSAGG